MSKYADEVNRVAAEIVPSTYPKWRKDLLEMIELMDPIYESQPSEAHAKGFAKVLVDYGCF